jgi:hypothetical protein
MIDPVPSSIQGEGLLVGYNAYRTRAQARLLHKRPHTTNHERRQVVGMVGFLILKVLSIFMP